MDKNKFFENVLKNRFLILSCIMLILGTFFGTSIIKTFPDELGKNLFDFISKSSTDLITVFINRFLFSFIIMVGLYFSGTGILGNFTAPFLIFIKGFVFGLENALNYCFSGIDYIKDLFVVFLTSIIFIDFMLLLMSENAIFSSIQLNDFISQKSTEKPHYNAKKITVKFITFTVILIIICLISSVIYKFIQTVL